MREKLTKLLLAVTMSGLLASCGQALAKGGAESTKCVLPPWPEPPELTIWECKLDGIVSEGQVLDTAICMTRETAVSLGLWVRAAEQYHEAAEACRSKNEAH